MRHLRYFMRHLELHLFLDCTENEVATTIANTLRRNPDQKGGDDRNKKLEVASADFSANETENNNGLISSEVEEGTSSDTFD